MNRLLLVFIGLISAGYVSSQTLIQDIGFLVSPLDYNQVTKTVTVDNNTYLEVLIEVNSTTMDAISSGALNPFDETQIEFYSELSNQNGDVLRTDFAYYARFFDVDATGQAEAANAVDPMVDPDTDRFRFRIRVRIENLNPTDPNNTPPVLSTYKLKVCQDESLPCEEFTVEVRPSDNQGYLSFPPNNYYLQFSNGDPFFAIGENLSFVNKNSFYDTETQTPFVDANTAAAHHSNYDDEMVVHYQQLLDELAPFNIVTQQFEGGNYIRIILLPAAFEVEWDELGNYLDHLYRMQDLETVLDLCRDRGVFVQLSLLNHSEFQLQDPNDLIFNFAYHWDNNQYNAIQGIDYPIHYFTNEEAKNFQRRKLKYLVSRFGNLPNVATIELQSEVSQIHGADHPVQEGFWNQGIIPGQTNKEVINGWVYEMGQYVKSVNSSILLSTGIMGFNGFDEFFGEVADFANYHDYKSYSTSSVNHSYLNNKYRLRHGKPYIAGELGEINVDYFGCGGWMNDQKPTNPNFHNNLWSTAFSGSFGTGLHWSWPAVHLYDATSSGYNHFGPIFRFFSGENKFNERNYQPFARICNTTTKGCVDFPNDPNGTPYTQFQSECLCYPTSYEPDPNTDYILDDVLITDMNSGTTVKDVEVYGLYSPNNIMGWVHNQNHYHLTVPTNYELCPTINGPTYAEISGYEITINGLFDCSGAYKVTWYSTYTNSDINGDGSLNDGGGLITEDNFEMAYNVIVFPNSSGSITFPGPPLGPWDFVDPNVENWVAPDYAFKITPKGSLQAMNADWAHDYVHYDQPTDPNMEMEGEMCFTPNDEIFYRDVNGHLNRHYYGGACWDHEVLDKIDKVHVKSKIVANSNNEIFYSNTSSQIIRLYFDQTTQTFETETNFLWPLVRPGTSLVLDVNDVLYYVNSNNDMTRLENNGTGTYIPTVYSNFPEVDVNSNVVLNDSQKPFYINNNSYITHIWFNGAGVADYYEHSSAPRADATVELAHSPTNKIFYKSQNGKLTQVWWNTSLNPDWWDAYEHTNAADVASYSPLAISDSDIKAYANPNGELCYAYYDGGWQYETYGWFPPVSNAGEFDFTSQNKLYYISTSNKLVQVYQDLGGQIHSYSFPAPDPANDPSTDSKVRIDKYDKVFYEGTDDYPQLWYWKNVCNGEFDKCTNYTKSAQPPKGENPVKPDNYPTINNGVQVENEPNIRVFPNPTTGQITIEMNNFEPAEGEKVFVMNVLGEVLLEQEIPAVRNYGMINIDLSEFGPGYYFIKLSNHEKAEKVVKF